MKKIEFFMKKSKFSRKDTNFKRIYSNQFKIYKNFESIENVKFDEEYNTEKHFGARARRIFCHISDKFVKINDF